jgi:hypothetical protein
MGLSFTIAAGPRQRSHYWVQVPRGSWHFTVSDSRLPRPGGPGPRMYIPQEQGGPVIPPGTVFLFVASYDSQGYGGGIRTRLHTGICRLSTNCPGYNISARTAKKTPLIVVVESFPWEHVCAAVTQQRPMYICLARGRCRATGLHATISYRKLIKHFTSTSYQRRPLEWPRWVGSTLTSYSESHGFKSRPRDRLSWYKFFYGCPNSGQTNTGIIAYQKVGHDRFLPRTFQFIIHRPPSHPTLYLYNL